MTLRPVTESLEGGVHTYGLISQNQEGSSSTPKTFAERVRDKMIEQGKLTRFSSVSGITISGGKTVIATPEGSQTITPLARDRIDHFSSISSSSSSQYTSPAPSTDTTAKSDQISKTRIQSDSSPRYSSTTFLDLNLPNISFTSSSDYSPDYLFSFDVMEYGSRTMQSGKEKLQIKSQGFGEVAFQRNGLLYEFKTTIFGHFYVYEGSEKDQLKMVGPGDTIFFIKPL